MGGRSRCLILMYHRIADDADDPFDMAVSPGHFAEHLDRVRARADVIPLVDVLERSPGTRIAITLDDGYADNATTALEILEAADVPATVFVASSLVGSAGSHWPYRLVHLFRHGRPAERHLDVEIAGSRLRCDLGSASARQLAFEVVHHRLRTRAPEEVASTMTALERQLAAPSGAGMPEMLSADQVRHLAESRHVTIGAHTRRHPWLASLSPTLQEREIAGSKADLEALTGRPIDLLAYPFGSRDAYNRHSAHVARRAGFALACTTRGGCLTPATGRYRLPRQGVGDFDGSDFDTFLRRWLEA